MKTFVAENVLGNIINWSSGMVVVKAENYDEAVKLIISKESNFGKKETKEIISNLRELKDNEVVYVQADNGEDE